MGSPRSWSDDQSQTSLLKAAVLDLRAARLDTVCHLLHDGRAHIGAMRSLVANNATLRGDVARVSPAGLTLYLPSAADLKQNGLVPTVRELAVVNICALGLGLLERTEAALDHLLPPKCGGARCGGEDEDEDDADTGGSGSSDPAWRLQIPRVLPVRMLHSISLQLSQGSDTIRVKLHLMQDTCAMVVRRLNISDIWQALKASIAASADRGQLAHVVLESPAAARASELAHLGCERILATRLGHLLREYGAVRFIGAGSTDPSGSASSAEVLEEPAAFAVREAESAARTPRGPLAREEEFGHHFRLVIKNSFIEIVEEDPELAWPRRARSCDAAIHPSSPGVLHAEGSPEGPPAQRPAAEEAHGEQAKVLGEPSDAPQGQRPGPTPLIKSSAAGAAKGTEASAEAAASDRAGEAAAEGAAGATDAAAEALQTTVMLRNLPPQYTRSQLLEALDAAGFRGVYDFAYLPVDFTRGQSLGYALIGTQEQSDAQRLLEHFRGAELPGLAPGVLCDASWNEPSRTLEEHIERYRNSPVMHSSMPDDYKPVIFKNGERQEFPPPTKPIRAPRIRHLKASESGRA